MSPAAIYNYANEMLTLLERVWDAQHSLIKYNRIHLAFV